jgi:GAF domain-containing protein/predicted hydrocarbon binding protein/anti-sigma regulatory factor (Ser/Thr protein kinase)
MELNALQNLLSEKSAGFLQLSGARMALLDIQAGFWGIRRQMETLVGARLTNTILQQAGANGGASFAQSLQQQTDIKKSVTFSACVSAYQAAGFGQFEIVSLEWPLGHIHIRATDAFEAWMYQQRGEKTEESICAYSAGVFVGFVNILSERQDVVCIEHTCQAKGDENCTFELMPASNAEGQTIVPYVSDPGLGRQINLLEMLFERMPMGIAVLDREFHVQRYNPTWEDFSARYAPSEGATLIPGVGYFEHLPGSEAMILPLFERTLEGETVRQDSVRLESGGIVTYWDVVLMPLVENNKITGMLVVSIDVTEKEMLHQNLEQRVEERTRELQTILQISRDINANLDLESLLEIILDQLKSVVNYSGASVFTLESNELVLRAYQGPIPAATAQKLRFPIEQAFLNNEVHKQQALIIADIRDESELAEMFRQTAGDQLDSAFGYVRSWLGVPLTVKGVMLGMLTLDHSQTDFFKARHRDLVQTFANQVAVAIENARLYHTEQEQHQESERRRIAAESLRDIMAALNSERSSQEIFDYITARSAQLLRSDACLIYSVHGKLLTNESSYNMPEDFSGLRSGEIYLGVANRSLLEGNPVQIRDARAYLDDLLAKPDLTDFQRRWYTPLRKHYASYCAFPMLVRNQLFGGLVFYYHNKHDFDAEDIQLGTMLGEQAALAIENARLYQESERRAEESETLFSVQQAITSKLEMGEILQMIADEARRLTKTDISAVYLLERGELEISYVSGDVPENILGYRLALDDSIAGSVVKNREAILVSDTWADPRVDRKAADQVQARSLLIVPLISGQQTIGTITVANRTPGGFNPDDEQLLTKLATSVVISLENARLYQAEQDRREVAESMRDIVRMINSSIPLEEFLNRAVELAAQHLGASASILQKYDFANRNLVHFASHNMPIEFPEGYARPFDELQQPGTSVYLTTLAQGNPSFGNYPPVADAVKEIERNPDLSEEAKLQRLAIRKSFAGALAVPLLVQDETFGAMVFYYREPQEFDEEQIQLAMTYAEQVSLAIENARLHEAAEQAAVATERNRLARDLHDAVTQTLFSSTMIADVLPRIWERNPQEGRRRLEELRQLTRGALSEMRTLLVELRPAALEDTDLGDLIGHQVNAFIARTRLSVEFDCNCEHNPPSEIKEMFYRIAQEAFNNIAKHANATTVIVKLNCQTDSVELLIQDNGIGFDHLSARKEGLGMGIMEERARNMGAQLDINSQIDAGTQLNIIWNNPNNKEYSND